MSQHNFQALKVDQVARLPRNKTSSDCCYNNNNTNKTQPDCQQQLQPLQQQQHNGVKLSEDWHQVNKFFNPEFLRQQSSTFF